MFPSLTTNILVYNMGSVSGLVKSFLPHRGNEASLPPSCLVDLTFQHLKQALQY